MNNEPDRNQRRALGKGLSALLPQRPKPLIEPGSAKPEEFQSIPVADIERNTTQPRRVFPESSLEELAQSIRTHGIIQPITVRRDSGDKFTIVAGERRWRAAQRAGLKEIPALVRSVKPDELLELALIENIQREDLNPIEVAQAFARLIAQHGLTHEQIAERTGKNRTTVTNFLRLLKLPEPVREALASGRISMGHARALLNLENPAEQTDISQMIPVHGWSVRDVENYVANRRNIPGTETVPTLEESRPEKTEPPIDPNIRAALDAMSAALGTKVTLIRRGANKGKLEIEFYSAEDLDRIYSIIIKPE